MNPLLAAACCCLFLLALGCAGSSPSKQPAASPAQICESACQKALEAKQDLSSGPCLLDPAAEQPDWVCDVAHNPRQAVDDEPQNQCQSFRNGTSHHFVEVSPECALIREY